MKHIEIVERGSLNNILREQPLSMSDLKEPDTVLPAGGIKGVDAIISGNIASFEIYSRESVTPMSRRYPSGTRQVENSDYYRAQQDVWDLQDKVSRERDHVARLQAEYNDARTQNHKAQQKYYDFDRSLDVRLCRHANLMKGSSEYSKKSYEDRNCKEILSTLGRLHRASKNSGIGIGDIKIQLSSRKKQLERLERNLNSAP